MSKVTAYRKAEFLKRLNEILEDDDIVLVSTFFREIHIKGRGKSKVKALDAELPADAFKQQDGVLDISKAFPCAFVAGSAEMFSAETLDIVEYQKKYHQENPSLKKDIKRKKIKG